MFDVFREELFKTRKNCDRQWVIRLNESDGPDSRIELLDYCGFGRPKHLGSEILAHIRHRMVRPYQMDIGHIPIQPHIYGKTVDCVMITGSERGGKINQLATEIAPWDDILSGVGGSWSGPFVITGDALLVCRDKKEKLTTFTRRQALEALAYLLPYIENKAWYAPAANQIRAERLAGKKRKGRRAVRKEKD